MNPQNMKHKNEIKAKGSLSFREQPVEIQPGIMYSEPEQNMRYCYIASDYMELNGPRLAQANYPSVGLQHYSCLLAEPLNA